MEVYNKDGKSIAWSGKLVDLAVGGACFSTVRRLVIGEHILAWIRVFGEAVKEVTGHIVWARPCKNGRLYGLKFDSIKKVYPTGELKEY
jgi:hypothetical protein